MSPRLAHVILNTSQIQAMADWYSKVIDAEVKFQNPMMAFVTNDEEHHRLGFMLDPSHKPAEPVIDEIEFNNDRIKLAMQRGSPINHVAFNHGSIVELMERYGQLKRHGIAPKAWVNHGLTTSLYYFDPDGNQIELYVDNFETPEGIEQYYEDGRKAGFLAGSSFDPDALYDHLHKRME